MKTPRIIPILAAAVLAFVACPDREHEEVVSTSEGVRSDLGEVISYDEELSFDEALTRFRGPKRIDQKYLEALKHLEDIGIPLSERLIDGLSLEEVIDDALVARVGDLVAQGIDAEVAFVFASKEITDEELAEVKKLSEAGMQIDGSYLTIVRRFTSDDRVVPTDTLGELSEAGIDINASVVGALTEEKSSSKKYIDALIDLHENGIEVTSYLVRSLSIEKTESRSYMRNIAYIYENFSGEGLDISRVISRLPLEEGKKKKYVRNLVVLGNAGYDDIEDMPEEIPIAVMLDDEHVEMLVAVKDKYNLRLHFIFKEWLGNDKFLEGLVELKRAGINVEVSWNGAGIAGNERLYDYAHTDMDGVHLAITNILYERAIDFLRFLHEHGIHVDSNFVDNLESLVPERSDFDEALEQVREDKLESALEDKPDATVSAIGKIQENAGTDIALKMVGKISEEDAEDTEYVDTLARLALIGVDILDISNIKREDLKDKGVFDFIVAANALGGKKFGRCLDNPQYRQGYLRLLELTQARYEDKLYEAYYCERIADPQYVEGWHRLLPDVKSEDLPLEKGADKEYVDGLVELADAGVSLEIKSEEYRPDDAPDWRYLWVETAKEDPIEALSLEKVKDPKYRDALIKVASVGVKVDDDFIKGFSIEKAHSSAYVRNLMRLHEAGIVISAGDYVWGTEDGEGEFEDNMLEALSLEKGTDTYFVSLMIQLHKRGIKVTPEFITCLDLERANNPDYIHGLLELQDQRVDVSGLVCTEEAEFEEFKASILEIAELVNESGEFDDHFDMDVINAITDLDDLFDHHVDMMERLWGEGPTDEERAEIQTSLGLSVEKATSPEYREFLAGLPRAVVSRELVGNIGLEYAAGGGTRLRISSLNSAGVDLSAFTEEKIGNSKYVYNVKDLAKEGVEVDRAFVLALTVEKGTSEPFMAALSKLHAGGVIVSGNIVRHLDMRYIDDQDYIDGLIELSLGGVGVGFEISELTHAKVVIAQYRSGLAQLYDQGCAMVEPISGHLTIEQGVDSVLIAGISENIEELNSGDCNLEASDLVSKDQ